MKQYEGMFILDASLGGSQLKELLEEIQQTVIKEGGVIDRAEEWGKRRMAYAIEKQFEGFYLLLFFSLLPEKADRVRSLYQLNERIIKFMILNYVPAPPRPEPVEEKKDEEKPQSQEPDQETEAVKTETGPTT